VPGRWNARDLVGRSVASPERRGLPRDLRREVRAVSDLDRHGTSRSGSRSSGPVETGVAPKTASAHPGTKPLILARGRRHGRVGGRTVEDSCGTAVTRLVLVECTEAERVTIAGRSLAAVLAILDAHDLQRDPILAHSTTRKLEARKNPPDRSPERSEKRLTLKRGRCTDFSWLGDADADHDRRILE
jgi:hypothetical protein